jgi:hypothetical protein
MPLKVVIQTIDGKRLEEAVPENAALNRLLPLFEDVSFPMLRFIDPYGNTIFSTNQMHGFLPEWDRLSQRVTGEEDSQFVSRVRQMAERCKKNPHTFLRFVGD